MVGWARLLRLAAPDGAEAREARPPAAVRWSDSISVSALRSRATSSLPPAPALLCTRAVASRCAQAGPRCAGAHAAARTSLRARGWAHHSLPVLVSRPQFALRGALHVMPPVRRRLRPPQKQRCPRKKRTRTPRGRTGPSTTTTTHPSRRRRRRRRHRRHRRRRHRRGSLLSCDCVRGLCPSCLPG